MKTTIKIDEKVRDELKRTKRIFNYPTMEELILDCCDYFQTHKVSPKEAKEPVVNLFSKFSDRFFGAFNKNNKEILIPFIKDSYTFYKDLQGKNITAEEKNVVQAVEPEEGKFEKLKLLILELDKLKHFQQSGEASNIVFNAVEFNKIMDKIKLM
jgi:hypothetical protein